MEKEKQKQKSINEILPLELIQLILLRVPARHLGGLRCVSKLWQSLISDPHFAESHLHHSPTPTHAYRFIENCGHNYFYYLDALFNDYDNEDASAEVRMVPPSFKKHIGPNFGVMLSCRGFLLLIHSSDHHLLVVFNPLTGDASETICCSHILSHLNKKNKYVSFYGFGYDVSQDDYLFVVAWNDDQNQDRFHCFSLRSNSWIHLDFALPTPLGEVFTYSPGLFLNGAIHWVSCRVSPCSNDILVFDMKERTFSQISAPKQVLTGTRPDLVLLGGCLALYFHVEGKTNIWVMKEYKVQSSWTLYVISCYKFKPLYLSSNGDIIGLHLIRQDGEQLIIFLKYNVLGALLKCYKFLHTNFDIDATNDVYTETLLPLPTSDLKDKDKKKKINGMKKAKERSSMEKQKQKQKSINEILPLELIQRILLSVPVKQLARMRCVSKHWQSLISDPHFAESHLHHSPAAIHAYLFIENYCHDFYYLDALFDDYNEDASEVRVVLPPFKKKLSPNFTVLLSCLGFLLLTKSSDPSLLAVFNPLTGDVSETICCSHILSHLNKKNKSDVSLYGFGYDASQDDYLLVVAWNDDDNQDRLHCFSLRFNSWIHLDYAFPKPLGVVPQIQGLFLNGAIHWVSYRVSPCSNDLLVFDMKERTFSQMSTPKQVATRTSLDLVPLGGCLALYFHEEGKTNIWVMKEYKVQSSWTLYVIPCNNFKPLYLSNNGDIIGLHHIRDGEKLIRFLKYNLLGELLKCYKFLHTDFDIRATSDVVYTETLLPLPTSDIKDKDKKKKKINGV
ncbi:hypothetical protein PIB30_010492 [Stylosanthes scabra]|uniref:F-box domain-containing protein n=1 Tax=Stylosanthes scabra TaxID=79078 RepID=A0ABU6Q5L8_9FABA|nr:hypothetical protein [Stylosanthes scabra]